MIGMLTLGTVCSPALGVDLETLVMPGPVIAGHADLESDCDLCHVPLSRERQIAQCLSCHEEVADDLAGSVGYHGRSAEAQAEQCSTCHTDHEGRQANILGGHIVLRVDKAFQR